ncbi:MAG: bifunctional hydroxymethylpyrimidine kinase/phosphomethylpyrimidine kinase [Streptosporangiaceae bacterium]
MTVPVMLSVAGSDPSGGAGIQADLKTATALGVYGAAVITSLTAQNTTGVSGIFGVPAEFVARQYESVVTDLDVHALKIGMLGSADVVVALAEAMRRYPVRHVVLDPVMVATSGDRLVPEDTVDAIRTHLLPLASVVTPNLLEAGTLLGWPAPRERGEMAAAAAALRELGAGAALVKGGHLTDTTSDDVLVDAEGAAEFASARVATGNTHGTGCTLSSAIASMLVRRLPLRQAVEEAKNYVTGALRGGADLHVGAGSGPVDHLWRER